MEHSHPSPVHTALYWRIHAVYCCVLWAYFPSCCSEGSHSTLYEIAYWFCYVCYTCPLPTDHHTDDRCRTRDSYRYLHTPVERKNPRLRTRSAARTGANGAPSRGRRALRSAECTDSASGEQCGWRVTSAAHRSGLCTYSSSAGVSTTI
jgi:hypothetical protein